MLVVAVALLATLSGLAASRFVQSEIPTPTPTPTRDVNRAYINSVERYGDALTAYTDWLSRTEQAMPSATATPDEWSKPEFQTLMSTLWQAPLTILAIVFAIAGLGGYQGYLDIRKRLEQQVLNRHDEFQKEFSNKQEAVMSFSIALGQLDAVWRSWELALDLVKENKKNKDKQKTDEEIEKLIDRELPPKCFVETPGALPHVRFAKSLSVRALFYLDQVPKELRSQRGAPQEYYQLEARQQYAYYVATDYEKSKELEWADALKYSELACKALDSGRFDQESSLAGVLEGMKENWLDTYLYARVLYLDAAKAEDWSVAKNQFRQAADRDMRSAKPVRERFREQFKDSEAYLSQKEKSRNFAVSGAGL